MISEFGFQKIRNQLPQTAGKITKWPPGLLARYFVFSGKCTKHDLVLLSGSFSKIFIYALQKHLNPSPGQSNIHVFRLLFLPMIAYPVYSRKTGLNRKHYNNFKMHASGKLSRVWLNIRQVTKYSSISQGRANLQVAHITQRLKFVGRVLGAGEHGNIDIYRCRNQLLRSLALDEFLWPDEGQEDYSSSGRRWVNEQSVV